LGTLKSNGSSKTFQYNADGTMKTDGLRTLALTYNYLKLPRTVKRGTTSTVTYIYDADGNKLAVSQDGTAKNYYCGDFVYDGSLAVAYILTPNGQLTRNPTTGAYTSQYNIPDHLGNVRSVVSSSGTVLQSTDYYPFGLAFSDSNIASNRYLYNGKELEDYTLGTSYLGTLDYGARHYDPRIARWTVPDPMAEKYYGVNAYGYCAGNPVMMIDPDGKSTYVKDEGNGRYRVIGGDLNDNDLNIYEYFQDENGNYTIRGNSIGFSLTTYSFFSFDLNNGEGGWMQSSIINTNDNSGIAFLNGMIDSKGIPTTSLFNYMDNARNNGIYDFKAFGDHYRGMPVGVKDGINVFASARDIGNYVAGYYAGANGFSWNAARWAFDLYQARGKESISSISAQYLGWSDSIIRYSPWTSFFSLSQFTNDLSFFIAKNLMK
jgi:RHS repeat-associated protein